MPGGGCLAGGWQFGGSGRDHSHVGGTVSCVTSVIDSAHDALLSLYEVDTVEPIGVGQRRTFLNVVDGGLWYGSCTAASTLSGLFNFEDQSKTLDVITYWKAKVALVDAAVLYFDGST